MISSVLAELNFQRESDKLCKRCFEPMFYKGEKNEHIRRLIIATFERL